MSDEKQQAEETFPTATFSKGKQEAILGHMLICEQFFQQCYGRVQPSWFTDRYCGIVWDAAAGFYKAKKRPPTVQEIKDLKQFLIEDPKYLNKIRATIDYAVEKTAAYGLDVIRPELTEWMHARIFRQGVDKASGLYNQAAGAADTVVSNTRSQKLKEAYGVMKSTLKEIEETSFEEEEEERFDTYQQDFTKNEESYKDAITWGYSVFDQCLTPKADSGSLLRGDTTVVLAPTNAGKTTTMITVGVHNLKKRRHVLMLSHEGRPEDIKEKVWCSLLDIPATTLYSMMRDPEGQKILDSAAKFLQKYLTYIPLNRAGLTVEEVVAIIRKKQEYLMSINEGRGYDLLIDDYPAKLKSQAAGGDRWARRERDDEVYGYFVNLALEYKFHSLVAIQTNREGSKVNSGQMGSDRLLRMEDVMESWGPMTSATNVISINRDPVAEAKGRVTFYICKSRSSEKGIAVVCRSNYAHSITHSDSLGGTWYRGASTMADKVDDYLQQYNNRKVDDTELYQFG